MILQYIIYKKTTYIAEFQNFVFLNFHIWRRVKNTHAQLQKTELKLVKFISTKEHENELKQKSLRNKSQLESSLIRSIDSGGTLIA